MDSYNENIIPSSNLENNNNKKQNVEYREESLALFFDRPFEHSIRFKSCINQRYFKNANIAAPVLRLRNILIILTITEIFASIWGFSYYFIRRSMVYIIINTSALILSMIGIYSTIFINEFGLILYSLVI